MKTTRETLLAALQLLKAWEEYDGEELELSPAWVIEQLLEILEPKK